MSFGSNSSNPSSSMSSGSPGDNLRSRAGLLKQLEQEFQKHNNDNNNSPGVADAGHDDGNNDNNDNHNDNRNNNNNNENNNNNNNDNNNNINLPDCSAAASREGLLACEKTKLCLRLASATKVHCWKADLPTLGVAFLKQEICGSTHCAKAIADYSDLCATHPILMSEPMTLSMYQETYCPSLHKHYEHCSTGMRDPRSAFCTSVTGCHQKLDRLSLFCPMPGLRGQEGLMTTAINNKNNNHNNNYNDESVCGPSCTIALHEIFTDCDGFDEVNAAVDGVIAYQDSFGCRARTSERFSNRQRGAVLPPYNQSIQSMAFPALMLLLALSVAAYSLCGRLVRQRPPLALCRKKEDEDDHKELICQSGSV
ncbi:unnamed protein product [Polarella glacialis]|uniref:Uncharacterized protein n=1 Tax=Polarella glacialis TaxID=89957 RepID=A0A813I5W0_POLGL|nr:unnamed protein product [Polarella glacialis]